MTMAGHGPINGERSGPTPPPWLAPGDGGDHWRRAHRRSDPPEHLEAAEHVDADGRHAVREAADGRDDLVERDDLDEVEARAARLLGETTRPPRTPEPPDAPEPGATPEVPEPAADRLPPPPGWPDPYGHDGAPVPPGWPVGYLPPGPVPPWPYPPPPPGWLPPPPAMFAPPAPQPAPPPAVERPAPQAFWDAPRLDRTSNPGRDRDVPQKGWRRALHKMSGGHVNPGVSRRDRDRAELLAAIRHPFVGDFRIAVLSIKGGVGKTTTTLGLGSALAMVRGDRVIAVDANPDRGTLAERVQDASTTSTVRDLLKDNNIHRYADVRSHTRMAISRLEVLASEQDPAVAEVFGEADYRQTMEILRQYYNIVLTDCGTGIMHSAMAGVLDLAHAIVLVSSPAIDAARSASATLDWLQQHGYGGLVRDAHVVFSAARPGSAEVRMDRIREHFAARCRSIHVIPFDQHLAEGAEIDFALLDPGTLQAYLGLAGAVAEKFVRLRSPLDDR
jgi:MinD-like ATPase involved in chromosome partitioning or flagellar assembly